ncbi:hypothetical protein ACLKA7_010875 [Drosophila subpalustris]
MRRQWPRRMATTTKVCKVFGHAMRCQQLLANALERYRCRGSISIQHRIAYRCPPTSWPMADAQINANNNNFFRSNANERRLHIRR